MSTPEFKLDTNAPTVNWADSKNSGESASTAQVLLSFEHHMTKCYLYVSFYNDDVVYGCTFFVFRLNLYMSKTYPRLLLKSS